MKVSTLIDDAIENLDLAANEFDMGHKRMAESLIVDTLDMLERILDRIAETEEDE